MKKTLGVVILAVLAGVAGIFAIRPFFVESVSAQAEVSERTAKVLQGKIDAIKKARDLGGSQPPATVEATEEELESYVLISLREEIPAKVESIDVVLTPGAVAAHTKMTFGANPTNNAILDVLISGTHRFFVKGQLSATGGKGKFILQEARVDGIPVPIVLIETLIEKHVKPKYPDVKLDEPFTMPWGIEELTITAGKARIVY